MLPARTEYLLQGPIAIARSMTKIHSTYERKKLLKHRTRYHILRLNSFCGLKCDKVIRILFLAFSGMAFMQPGEISRDGIRPYDHAIEFSSTGMRIRCYNFTLVISKTTYKILYVCHFTRFLFCYMFYNSGSEYEWCGMAGCASSVTITTCGGSRHCARTHAQTYPRIPKQITAKYI